MDTERDPGVTAETKTPLPPAPQAPNVLDKGDWELVSTSAGRVTVGEGLWLGSPVGQLQRSPCER